MRWQEGRQSTNVRDKRNQSISNAEMSFRAGSMAIGTALLRSRGSKICFVLGLLLVGLGYIGFSLVPESVKHRFSQAIGQYSEPTEEQKAESQRRLHFVSSVLAETEDVWKQIFTEQGKQYQEPGLVLYRMAIRSSCGAATNAIGPFYCPNDRIIYLDESFFDQLAKEFSAPGEFASAYVIAHEVGHHVQNIDGTLEHVDGLRDDSDEKANNVLTVRLELQADCYAGIWAHHMKKIGVAEGNDIDLALNAAHKIGDDNLQRAAQGEVVPDSFTHGSSAQRAHWFKQGFTSGNPQSCNTITGEI